jgi:predicted secreted protein
VFGQYGLGEESAAPFAEIYAVDVSANAFLRNGVFKTTSNAPLSLGQDGSGAFYNLLRDASPLLQSNNVDHLNSGRPIYILVDGNVTPDNRLSFRDFNADVRYDVRLIQSQRGAGDGVSAAFHIELVLTDSANRARSLTVGRPGHYREGVASYRITQILVGPDDASLIFVVERRGPGGSVRFMVETTTL